MAVSKFSHVLEQPERWLSEQQRRWLRPRGRSRRIAYVVLFVLNWVLIRFLFRLSIKGREHLRGAAPVIVAPNHASPFDPPILAAALPLSMLQQTYWASKQSTVLKTRTRTLLSWLTRVIPIGDDSSALAAGAAVLSQNQNLVWFPEGRRSLDGRLQEFRPGIVFLLAMCNVPVVPVYVEGAYEAFPTGARFPRLRARIIVRIGAPRTPAQLRVDTTSPENVERSAAGIRECVSQLRPPQETL